MAEQTSSPKANPWMISTLLLVGVVVGFSASQITYFKNADGSGSAAVIKEAESLPPSVEPSVTLTDEQIAKLADDDPVIGDADAEITMVEFSDFQCPFCARFFKNTFPAIEEEYIKTGKVKFVYRDFPLDSHPQAEIAALAGECGNEQGKFREMHDMLFNEQPQWSGNPEASAQFKEYAKTLGLDTKQFGTCLDSKKYVNEVRKDLVDGVSMGVTGTPSFFINGKTVSGALPYDIFFKPILDAELEGKKWDILVDAIGNPTGVRVY